MRSYGALSSPPRNCKIPYTSAAAAADTLSDPTWPRTRQRDQLVAGGGHARAQAAPLGAQHQHHAARVVGRVVGHRARPASAP